MGVTNLWQVLEPVQAHQTLSSLKGQTLAVDLSIWVCETQCVKQMQGVVSKPYLRNLFFRISHLLQLGVHLVFVIEGRAPELKQQVMAKRQETRFPQRKAVGGQRQGGRRNFNACLKECCEMLDYLGVPYVHSPGEAEATCAALNASGVVDACLTNDGDAFLYGARTVYRNFTMNTKDPHVECYCMTDVEERLGLSREKLVAMALLLGCDYLPKGVPGVGVERAIKLMNALPSSNVLKRFETWSSMAESCCIDTVEVYIRRKALLVQDFPQKEVIQEFLHEKKKTPRHISEWCRPSMSNLQVFCLNKLEWPVEYTVEKVLPLITLWDMSDLTSSTPQTDRHLVPKQIVKSRVRHGVACYEILWNQPETDSGVIGDVYRTIEEQVLFRSSYPQIVAQFDIEQENKKVKTKRKSRKKKNTEKENGTEEREISERIASVNVKEEDDVECNGVGDDIDTEVCDKDKQIPSESKLDARLLYVQPTQQMKASPMHSLELALRSVPRRSEKDGHVAVERNLNFSSSEEDEEELEEEYLPLSQRLQLKIAKPRGCQRREPQSRGSSTNNQGGEGIDVMVRAISQGVSGALRGCFSSDSDSDDLQTFSSQTGTKLDSSVTDNELTSTQTSSEKHQSSPSGNSQICLQKTPIWERRTAKSTEAITKGDYLDVPDINFSVLTPDVLGRSMPSVRIRSGASSSTPEGQHVDSMSKFSYNLSNLSPHLSENAMVSPFLRPEALHSPITMTSCEKLQTYHNFSTLWENTSMNRTNGAVEFGDFEVQTSLLNSFNKLIITDQEKTSMLSDVGKKVFDSPSEIKRVNLGENIFDSPSGNKEFSYGQSENSQEDDSVIIVSSTSDLSFSVQTDKMSENPNTSDKNESVGPSPLRSVLATVNRQKDRQSKPQCNKERTRDHSQSSPVCVGKENEAGGQWEGEECSRHSPLSLIDRLRQRLSNQSDSGLITNFKPFSVKPVKPVK